MQHDFTGPAPTLNRSPEAAPPTSNSAAPVHHRCFIDCSFVYAPLLLAADMHKSWDDGQPQPQQREFVKGTCVTILTLEQQRYGNLEKGMRLAPFGRVTTITNPENTNRDFQTETAAPKRGILTFNTLNKNKCFWPAKLGKGGAPFLPLSITA